MLAKIIKEHYRRKTLINAEIVSKISPFWIVNEASLERTFEFKNFSEAVDFLTIGKDYINSYNIEADMWLPNQRQRL